MSSASCLPPYEKRHQRLQTLYYYLAFKREKRTDGHRLRLVRPSSNQILRSLLFLTSSFMPLGGCVITSRVFALRPWKTEIVRHHSNFSIMSEEDSERRGQGRVVARGWIFLGTEPKAGCRVDQFREGSTKRHDANMGDQRRARERHQIHACLAGDSGPANYSVDLYASPLRWRRAQHCPAMATEKLKKTGIWPTGRWCPLFLQTHPIA